MALLVGISPGVAIADVQFSVRLGPAKIVAGSGGLRGSVRLGTHHRNRIRHPKAYDPYHQRRRVIVYRDRVREEEIPAQPVAIPPVSTQPEDPPAPSVDREPLDPVGHARVTSAPGAVPARFGLGDRVPTGVPHVTLDAERYGLPRAPEGELYARVRNQVLRITNTDRQITELIVD
ncbi:MAG: hypothetical protein AAGH68_13035 [Pseudomonadota bacterium]